ncbi:MAG: hypothetical protein IPH69_17895 [Bacteroidales bacterium]|nr:hypothetical protein [Bacteroidales bacterium]
MEVVEDFYINGVWQAVEPAMLRIIPSERFGLIAVTENPEDLAAVLEDISLKWKNLKTNSVFGGRLQEDLMQEEKDINGSIMKVNIFLAIVATLLSLIGMYNLVSLDIIKRTKEMGIRKIQGAPVPVIMYLVAGKFIIVLVIASIAGSVGGYYLSIMLMDSIWDYFVDISMGMILAAVSVMFVATSITVIFKIIRAAMKNPVVSLRYE